MIQKITFSGMKGMVCLGALLAGSSVSAQIYDNGGLSTGPTTASGVAAPTGYTWSEAQSEAGNTTESNTNAGYSAIYNTANTVNFQLADDFTVPAGEQWAITQFEFFGYQTGFTGLGLPIDALRIQVFNGDPQNGGTLVAGNMTTNVLNVNASGDALMYRIFNTTTPSPGTVQGTTRKIYRFVGDLAVTLDPGTYWVVFQVHAANDGALFVPPVTIQGIRGLPGANGKQNVIATTTVPAVLGWAPLVDSGNPSTAPDFNQEVPFKISGEVNLAVANNSFSAKISVYPNPVGSNLNVSLPTDVTADSMAIIDIAGRTVRTITSGFETINVSDLAPGHYLLQVKSGNEVAVKKFIKK